MLNIRNFPGDRDAIGVDRKNIHKNTDPDARIPGKRILIRLNTNYFAMSRGDNQMIAFRNVPWRISEKLHHKQYQHPERGSQPPTAEPLDHERQDQKARNAAPSFSCDDRRTHLGRNISIISE